MRNCNTLIVCCLIFLQCATATEATPSSNSVNCQIEEEMPAGTLVCDLAKKKSFEVTSQTIFKLGQEHDVYFILNKTTGTLYVKKVLNREHLVEEKKCKSESAEVQESQPLEVHDSKPAKPCMLELDISYQESPQEVQETFTVLVEIVDINDNYPQFPIGSRLIQRSVKENDREASIPLPIAEDLDYGNNGSITYLFPDDLKSTPMYLNFYIENRRYGQVELKIQQNLDKEVIREPINLTIIARDGGEPFKESNITLLIDIEDENEFPPEFQPIEKNHFKVKESFHPGNRITQLKAIDKDATSRIKYGLIPSYALSSFWIDSASGELFLHKKLDAETKITYYLTVTASDGDRGGQSHTATASIVIQVTDENDNAPDIKVVPFGPKSDNEFILVEENQIRGVAVAVIKVSDKDKEEQNNRIYCKPLNINLSSDDFKLELQDGNNGSSAVAYKLMTSQPLDREKRERYNISLTCSNQQSESFGYALNTTKLFTVLVSDVNDNGPRFDSDDLTIQLAENKPVGSLLGRLSARDPDSEQNARTYYELTNNESDSYVRVERTSGKIYSQKMFDREHTTKVTFSVRAYDVGNVGYNATQQVILFIDDVNDNHPSFDQESYIFTVEENSKPREVGRLTAKDPDNGVNGSLSFYLQQKVGCPFHLHADGQLMLMKPNLDREKVDHYNLIVFVFDRGVPSLTSTTAVTINVLDVNDHKPRFTFPNSSVSSINVSVNAKANSRIGQLEAVDEDINDNGKLTFTLNKAMVEGACPQSLIEVDKDYGQLFLLQDVINVWKTYQRKYCVLQVYVEDNASPAMRNNAILQIKFIDVPVAPIISSVKDPDVTSKELIIALGIGLAILVLCCVGILLIYFCYYLQRTNCTRWNCFGVQSSMKTSLDMGNICKPLEGNFSTSLTHRHQQNENKLYLKSANLPVQPYAQYSPADRDSGHGSLHKKISNNIETGNKLYMNELKSKESCYCKLDSTANMNNDNNGYGCLDVDSTIDPYCVYEGGNKNAATLHLQRIFVNQNFNSLTRSEQPTFEGTHLQYEKTLCSSKDLTHILEKQNIFRNDRSEKTVDRLGTIQRHAGYVYGSPYDSSSFV